MFTCGYLLHRLNPLVGTKLGFFSSFYVSTSSRLTLAEAFRSDHVAACSTAFRSAIEESQWGGYVIFPCPSKVTQHSSTADWLKFRWRHQITYEGAHTEPIFTFKVTLCTNSYNHCWKFVDIINRNLNYCTSQFKRWIYIRISFENTT